MATNIKAATVTGSGQPLDFSVSTTPTTAIGGLGTVVGVGTRILGISAAVTGTCSITDTYTSVNTSKTRTRIKFAGDHDVYFGEQGVKFLGKVMVSAPTSAAVVMLYYG
tara:strand:+ start:139 stop:465 length:327 start_codon:yes stop_codon:yes gene_type:complete